MGFINRHCRLLFQAAFFALCTASATAEEVLPPAFGLYSVAVVADHTKARLAVGTTVEFLTKPEKGAPKVLRIQGVVLGISDGVVFFELSERGAVALAKARAEGPVDYRKVHDADPAFVADRRLVNQTGKIASVAPHMRTLTVSTDVEPATVKAWKRGDKVLFLGISSKQRFRKNGDKLEIGFDIEVVFVSAEKTGTSRYDMTVIADPLAVTDLLKAEAEGRLSVSPEANKNTLQPSHRKRCTIRQLHGGQRITVEIPCQE